MNQSFSLYYLLIIISLALVTGCGCKNDDANRPSDSSLQEPSNDSSSDVIDKNVASQPGKNQGIPNIGNSCYMNATLQPVITLYEELLRKMKPSSTKQIGKKPALTTSAINLLNEVRTPPIRRNYTEKTNNLKASSQEFFANLVKSEQDGGLGWEGKCGRQEDALGFLISLLDWMKVPQIQTRSNFIDVASQRKKKAIGKDFASILNLAFPAKTPVTMQEIVDNSLKPEEGVDYKWEETDVQSTKVTKVPLLKGLNNLHNGILVLNLSRAGLDDIKNETIVNNPFKITIKKEQTRDLASDKSYQLISFIQHIGSSGKNGHYISYVKENNQWVQYNDAEVSIVRDDLAKEAASGSYMFFYKAANT